ncbi:MAG: MBL fold metallo-hydrolase [FCB group bacterium]|nr:MBL fold metallo-hydrolase [FCB group bacterium]
MKWLDCEVDKIDDNLYSIQPPKSGNIGLYLSGNAAMLIDSGYSPRRSTSLIEYIENRFECRIELLFNTHYHSDHTFGNQSFNCPIMASQACRDTMLEIVASHWAPHEIEKAKQEDPDLVDDWADLKLTPPDVTFDDVKEIDFHGQLIKCMLVGGHTRDSAIVLFPDKKTAFCGDLVFEGTYPTLLMHDETPQAFIEALSHLIALDVETIIPGHGAVCTKTMVNKMIAYWQCLQIACRDLVGHGLADDEIVDEVTRLCHLDEIDFNSVKHNRNINAVLHALRHDDE